MLTFLPLYSANYFTTACKTPIMKWVKMFKVFKKIKVHWYKWVPRTLTVLQGSCSSEANSCFSFFGGVPPHIQNAVRQTLLLQYSCYSTSYWPPPTRANSLFYPSLLKNSFAAYRIVGWWFSFNLHPTPFLLTRLF